MDITKYITLEQNLIKLDYKQKSLVVLEDPGFAVFASNGRERNRLARQHRKVIHNTKKNLKRLLVVIEKQIYYKNK